MTVTLIKDKESTKNSSENVGGSRIESYLQKSTRYAL